MVLAGPVFTGTWAPNYVMRNSLWRVRMTYVPAWRRLHGVIQAERIGRRLNNLPKFKASDGIRRIHRGHDYRHNAPIVTAGMKVVQVDGCRLEMP